MKYIIRFYSNFKTLICIDKCKDNNLNVESKILI